MEGVDVYHAIIVLHEVQGLFLVGLIRFLVREGKGFLTLLVVGGKETVMVGRNAAEGRQVLFGAGVHDVVGGQHGMGVLLRLADSVVAPGVEGAVLGELFTHYGV